MARDVRGRASAGDARPRPRSTPTLAGLHRALFVEPNPIPVKWALAELGLVEHGHPAAAGPARPGHHETVRAALRAASLL